MVHGDIIGSCFLTRVLSSQALSLILITDEGARSRCNPGVQGLFSTCDFFSSFMPPALLGNKHFSRYQESRGLWHQPLKSSESNEEDGTEAGVA